MNKQQIVTILSQPNHLNEQTLDQIKEILDEYPFFQAGRMLWIKNLHLLDHIRYNNELKLGAAHISDRARLFDLLHENDDFALQQDTIEIESEKDDLNASPEIKKFTELTDAENAVSEKFSHEASDDYFGAEDVFETESGEILDFSQTFKKEEDDIKYAFPDDADNIVLPSADLLGFDMDTSYYSLENEENASLDESRSFNGWLNVLKNKPVNVQSSKSSSSKITKTDKKMSLIDSFLEQGMKKSRVRPVKPIDKEEDIVDISAKSLQENEDLMTETLANIYIKQKHFLKAIDIFDRLRLKYPEKNLYFARRIKELEEQVNNK